MDKDFIGFSLYAIHNEGADEWWSLDDGWVDGLENECLFPTLESAHFALVEAGHHCKIVRVNIPQKERNYEYYPVPLLCIDCGKEERNPGLDVCGPCYHKRILGNN